MRPIILSVLVLYLRLVPDWLFVEFVFVMTVVRMNTGKDLVVLLNSLVLFLFSSSQLLQYLSNAQWTWYYRPSVVKSLRKVSVGVQAPCHLLPEKVLLHELVLLSSDELLLFGCAAM